MGYADAVDSPRFDAQNVWLVAGGGCTANTCIPATGLPVCSPTGNLFRQPNRQFAFQRRGAAFPDFRKRLPREACSGNRSGEPGDYGGCRFPEPPAPGRPTSRLPLQRLLLGETVCGSWHQKGSAVPLTIGNSVTISNEIDFGSLTLKFSRVRASHYGQLNSATHNTA